MYCKHCGRETDSHDVFCIHCGKRVNPTCDVSKNNKYKEFVNACTFRALSKSGVYLIGDLGIGFVIINEKNQKLVVDTVFEDVIIQDRENVDSILVKKKGKWGLINPFTGETICEFIYDDIAQVPDCFGQKDGEIIVYTNDLCGKIDCDGNIILPIIYDEISSFGRVKYQGLWGVVRNGEQMIPCDYIRLCGSASFDDLWDFQPSQYKNGKWGVINGHDGEIILEFEYDEIKFIESNDFYYIMRKDNKWGGIRLHDITIPCEYSLEEIRNKLNYFL